MLKSIRSSLLTTAMAMTPFLLSACDDNPDPNPKTMLSLMLLPLLFFTISLASDQLKRRTTLSVRTMA